jgi:hypothetical protein
LTSFFRTFAIVAELWVGDLSNGHARSKPFRPQGSPRGGQESVRDPARLSQQKSARSHESQRESSSDAFIFQPVESSIEVGILSFFPLSNWQKLAHAALWRCC